MARATRDCQQRWERHSDCSGPSFLPSMVFLGPLTHMTFVGVSSKLKTCREAFWYSKTLTYFVLDSEADDMDHHLLGQQSGFCWCH